MAPVLSKLGQLSLVDNLSKLNAKEVLIAAAFVATTASVWKSVTWGRGRPR